MLVCLTIPKDTMKVSFFCCGLLLYIILKETSPVFDIVTNHDTTNNDEKCPEISDDTTVLGKAVEDDRAVMYQELRNTFLAYKRNKRKRRKLKRKFRRSKQNQQQENLFINFSFLTKLS